MTDEPATSIDRSDGSDVQVSPRTRAWMIRLWTLIGAAIVLVGAWFVLREPLAIVAAPVGLAIVIVYLLNPIVGFAENRGVPRALGTLLTYAAVAAAMVGLVVAFGPMLADQTAQFIDELPAIFAGVLEWVNARLAGFGIEEITVDLESEDTRTAVADYLRENRDQVFALLRGAGTVVGVIFHGLLTLVLAPILAFYLLADLPRISEGITRLVPPGPRSDVLDVAGRIGSAVGAYFRGMLMVAAFVAVATSIGLAIVGLPFWAIVGGLTGLFNLVPLIGPFVGGAIGVIIALTVGGGTGQAIAVVVVMTVVQQIDNHAITPNVVSRTVKVHPVTVILGLLVAGTLYGILGMFVAIPVIAAAKLVVVYVLVTRVPSMRHLAGADPALFDDEGEPEPREGTLAAMGREMRQTWERRRRPDGGDEVEDRPEGAGDRSDREDADV
ncbi:MAG: AI-2E family transporter [Nitriliruptorales bacterium]|nr:AI-2E family transporter [Nitriliruptorales bacterium]